MIVIVGSREQVIAVQSVRLLQLAHRQTIRRVYAPTQEKYCVLAKSAALLATTASSRVHCHVLSAQTQTWLATGMSKPRL